MTIAELIAAHRSAKLADEAYFDEQGNCSDEDAAQESYQVEVDAYKALVSAPCSTLDDVQQKVAYLLVGTVGECTSLVDCLLDPYYAPAESDDSIELFLRSLIGRGQ